MVPDLDEEIKERDIVTCRGYMEPDTLDATKLVGVLNEMRKEIAELRRELNKEA